MYFSSKLWPDFDAAELRKALLSYAERERRFGRTDDGREKDAGADESADGGA